ncbi:AAA family ATPase [Rubellimicrobium roseum]|uniref:AAA family ATPase n=1 Tax=Rubellimicrobium roseum TaxID=687525 RepID=A0A5C4NR81_9RHOB|nr:ATP-binding protein [Rubellimicrobium roseum]TNC74909.1 AAA family ATPase [Rubellimicrobium roseum]
MSQTADLMELREEDIRRHYPAALSLLQGFDHAPRIAQASAVPPTERSPGIGTRRAFRPTTPGLVAQRTSPLGAVHLLARIEEVPGSDGLPSPLQATVAQAIRRAVAIALALAEQVALRSGLADLKRLNAAGGLTPERRPDFTELSTTEALVTLHVLGAALSVLLAPHAGTEPVEIGHLDEVLTDNAPLALHGALWELDQDIATLATSDRKLAATVLAFAEALMARVAARAAHAPGLQAFTSAGWRVAADELTIQGFVPPGRRRGGALQMAFKRPEEVVGNHIAKHQAMKLAKMLMAYDFQRRLNPFVEEGGFIFTFLGDGAPGTGKTTLIQMMAGLVHGYCEVAGYPFRYRNLSTDNIDSYQGKSGQNAKAFVTEITDPTVIGFGTIDDIDTLAGKRGDRQASAGQLEITAVLMESFAGANTVVRGNCTFGMFSNHPENVDDALRQRAGARFLVNGPQTREDYIDILALLLGRHHQIPVGEHRLNEAQAIQRAVAQSYAAHSRPQEGRLIEVWTRVQAEVGPLDTLAKIGTYLKAIQEVEPRFTGRAVKNITDAVKVRALDVELPDEWMSDPDLFLRKDYDTKAGMIRELRRPITPEIVLQEINRYADSEFRYGETSDEAAVSAAVRDMRRTEEARHRFLAGKEPR